MNNIILILLIVDLIVAIGLTVFYYKISSQELKATSSLVMKMIVTTGIIGLGLGTLYYLY
ncbi:hypothetical protein [Dysgonomonas sp. 520]|uniref:hypothetical protein n=1 Tax=Dysgonomonas sp. 520 TaxID=2302931 RepID=UPI0013D60CAE|nr:hypothetical protein [Dysgonomonas sp. 520]